MSSKSPARSALREGAPPSSPRLPSPPPLPELQLGPRSPSINAPAGELSLDNAAIQDEGAARRVRPGTVAADMAKGPPFLPLHQLESPFQLQEYLKSSYASVTRDEASQTVQPITKETAMQLATPPIQQDSGEPVDRNLWLYELCRFLVQRTNRLIVSFFADSPPCSNQTCPEMRASEWQYLCAVHEPPKSCCAIDYCCHTLDWAANVLTSTKHFPSRLSLGGEGGSAYQRMRQLTNIFRRVYRIYAHAWFQHREAFWMLEQEEGLYRFFRTVCDAYSLIPEDNYTIPPEAEGDKEDMVDTPVSDRGSSLSILRNDPPVNVQQPPPPETEPEPVSQQSIPTTAPTQRRHRHTPSTGTQLPPTVEGPEEEEDESNKTAQISQQVPSEPTATSTKASRSPRPEMSIPIEEVEPNNILAPDNPTPTPESHGSDPFAETNTSTTDVQEDVPPPTPATVTTTKPLPNALSTQEPSKEPEKSPKPQLHAQTSTPPPSNNDEDEEVRSPSGGSIRTVGKDILSGLMAHTMHSDDENNNNNAAPSTKNLNHSPSRPLPSEPSTAPTTSPPSVASSTATTATTTEDHDSSSTDEPTAKTEDDEDFGEIKLEKMNTAVQMVEPEAVAEEVDVVGVEGKGNVSAEAEDGEKKEEEEELQGEKGESTAAAAGVV